LFIGRNLLFYNAHKEKIKPWPLHKWCQDDALI